MHATKLPVLMRSVAEPDLSSQRGVGGKASSLSPFSTEPTVIDPPFPEDARLIVHDSFPRTETPHPARVGVFHPHC